jgi:hypothetical protein
MNHRTHLALDAVMPDGAQLRVTEPSGRAHVSGWDEGRTGWKRHIVRDSKRDTPAMCGLNPALGWGGDLFEDGMDICKRCLVAAGACRVCKGDMEVRVRIDARDSTREKCSACEGTGLKRRNP